MAWLACGIPEAADICQKCQVMSSSGSQRAKKLRCGEAMEQNFQVWQTPQQLREEGYTPSKRSSEPEESVVSSLITGVQVAQVVEQLSRGSIPGMDEISPSSSKLWMS